MRKCWILNFKVRKLSRSALGWIIIICSHQGRRSHETKYDENRSLLHKCPLWGFQNYLYVASFIRKCGTVVFLRTTRKLVLPITFWYCAQYFYVSGSFFKFKRLKYVKLLYEFVRACACVSNLVSRRILAEVFEKGCWARYWVLSGRK